MTAFLRLYKQTNNGLVFFKEFSGCSVRTLLGEAQEHAGALSPVGKPLYGADPTQWESEDGEWVVLRAYGPRRCVLCPA